MTWRVTLSCWECIFACHVEWGLRHWGLICIYFFLWQVQSSLRITIWWRSLPILTGRGFQSVLSMLGEPVQRVSLRLPMISLASHVLIFSGLLEFRHLSLSASPQLSMSVAALKPWGIHVDLQWSFTPERWGLIWCFISVSVIWWRKANVQGTDDDVDRFSRYITSIEIDELKFNMIIPQSFRCS